MSGPLLAIAPAVFARLPGLSVVVAVARGLDPTRAPEIDREWVRAWTRVHQAFGHPNPQAHPHVIAWRQAMRALGVHHKEHPTSVEALVRRALKSPLPVRINPFVDFYNSVSLSLVVPAGGFDLAAVRGALELRETVAGDTFQALDAAAAEPVPPGEVAYVVESRVLTRHLVWRQSREAAIRAETRQAIFVSELLGTQRELVPRVEEALAGGLRARCGAAVESAVLSEETPLLPVG